MSGAVFLFVCRPQEFLKCDLPFDLKGNSTAKDELGYGCVKVFSACYDYDCN